MRRSKGEAAMTAGSVRAAAIVLAAAGLAGCIDARSQYAPYAGYEAPSPRAPLRPQYPVSEQAGAAGPDSPQTRAPEPPALADDAGQAAPLTAPNHQVGAEPLPPVADQPASRAPTSDAGSDLAPTPLVWRPGADSAGWIAIAHHHHRSPAKADTASDQAASAPQTVVVRKGDTINTIAKRLGVTPKALIEANKLRHPRDLTIGQTLQAPSPKRSAGETREAETSAASGPEIESQTYVIKRGDTLYSLAHRYGVTVDQLSDANGLKPHTSLHAGQKIDVPGESFLHAGEPVRSSKLARPVRERRTVRPSYEFPPEPGPVGGAAVQPGPAAEPMVEPSTAGAEPVSPVPYTSLPGAPAPGQAPSPAYTPPVAPTASPPAASPYVPPPTASISPEALAPAAPSDAQIAAAGRGRFAWPVTGQVLTGYGPLPGGQRNDGLDIAAPEGAPVRAAASGDVVYAGNLVPGFGNLVLVKHDDGWVTAYAHLSRTEVKIKDHVQEGTEIGAVGETGGVAQPELHFEIRYAPSPRERARPIDPTLVLPAQPLAPPG
jgi:murein DD-endopeptidase MepM/ murein hydrolase activator NlpD